MSARVVRAALLAVALLGSAAHSSPARPRVVVGVAEAITSLNVFAPATLEGYRATGLVHEALARVDARTDRLEPWLATDWTVGPKGLRVRLRDDVRTHDGRVVDAGTVVRAFYAYRDPANRAATWLPMLEPFAGARAVSPREVEFLGARPTYEAVRNLLTGLRLPDATGPFAVKARLDTRLELAPRPKWWHGTPPNFDLILRPVADRTLARALIARGELDVYAGGGDDEGVPVAGAEGFWIDLNLRRPVFRDVAVRRALLRAWDRVGLNARVFGGARRPALDAFDPARALYPAGAPEPFDPAAARKALKPPITFEILVPDAERERWVGLYQNNLAEVGVTMTITRVSADAGWWTRLRDGAYDAVAGGGTLLKGVDAAAWGTKAPYNTTGFSDPVVDRSLKRLAHEFDPARRAVVERELIRRIRARVAQLPGLITDHASRLTSARVTLDPQYPDDVWRWRTQH